jgi:hypothetical protein
MRSDLERQGSKTLDPINLAKLAQARGRRGQSQVLCSGNSVAGLNV